MRPRDDSAEESETQSVRSSPRPYAELFDVITAALRAHEKAKAVRTAVEAVTSGYITISALYRDVLTPLLAGVGAGWQRGTVAVWEEHLAGASVRTVVEILYPGVLKAKAVAVPTGKSVLLACPPEEAHDLGLRMVADRFDMAGWTTYFLGADTPVEEIVDAASRLGVDAVVMSSSTHWHRAAVRHAVDHVKGALPSVDVWVGGSAFIGDVTGWRPHEIVDLDMLLGEGEGAVSSGAVRREEVDAETAAADGPQHEEEGLGQVNAREEDLGQVNAREEGGSGESAASEDEAENPPC